MEMIELLNDTIKEWQEDDLVSDDSIDAIIYVRDHLVPIFYNKQIEDLKLKITLLEGEYLLEDDRINKQYGSD